MTSTTSDSNSNGTNKISEVLFDILHVEIVNHFRQQHDLQPYLDSGLDIQQAQSITQRIMLDQIITMGQHIGKKLTLKLLQDNPVLNLPQGVDNAPLRFICSQLWTHLFNKPADFQILEKGTYIIRENNLRWISRFSPSHDTLNDYIRPGKR